VPIIDSFITQTTVERHYSAFLSSVCRPHKQME